MPVSNTATPLLVSNTVKVLSFSTLFQAKFTLPASPVTLLLRNTFISTWGSKHCAIHFVHSVVFVFYFILLFIIPHNKIVSYKSPFYHYNRYICTSFSPAMLDNRFTALKYRTAICHSYFAWLVAILRVNWSVCNKGKGKGISVHAMKAQREWKYSSILHNLSTRCRWVASFIPGPLSSMKNLWNPLSRSLRGHQNQSGLFGENSLGPSIRWTLDHPACSTVAMTELCWLLSPQDRHKLTGFLRWIFHDISLF
jgi:hypothetical protein